MSCHKATPAKPCPLIFLTANAARFARCKLGLLPSLAPCGHYFWARVAVLNSKRRKMIAWRRGDWTQHVKTYLLQ